MYELIKSDFGPVPRFQVHHPASGNGFSVVPGAGATVVDIQFDGFNILDGCSSPEELADNPAAKTSLLFPFPNRLDGGRYTWEGKSYGFPINDGGTGNAIHGFVRDAAFEIDNVVLAKHYGSITCAFHYSGQLAYYPFPFQLNVEYSIFDHGVFRLGVECRNLHVYDIPIGFGWHPYFRLADRTEDFVVQLPPCRKMEIDDRMLPTGQRLPFPDFEKPTPMGATSLDNAFRVQETLERYDVVLAANGRKLSMRANRHQFPYFMVFTPPDRRTVALEPMSCNMNAFNNGDDLVSLPPDGVWKALLELHWQ